MMRAAPAGRQPRSHRCRGRAQFVRVRWDRVGSAQLSWWLLRGARGSQRREGRGAARRGAARIGKQAGISKACKIPHREASTRASLCPAILRST
eukprot:scaffold1748_cov258-Pinguiococcus_pyrenoidosus.AAC.5